MIKKAGALLGAMMALITLSGCFEVDSTISLKKDGSGTVTETVTMGAQAAGMMKMSAGEGAEDPFAKFDEAALKTKAETMGDGVEFVGVKKTEGKDGSLTFTTTYKFSDISNLIYDPGAIMDDEAVPAAEEDKMFSFKDGVLTISVPEPDEEGFAMGDEEMGEEEMAMMAPMMAGMKMTAKIVCEGGIESTNATYHEGNTVIMMNMNMDEILANEGGIKSMNALKGGTREEFAKAVKGVNGFEVESIETVTIKLK